MRAYSPFAEGTQVGKQGFHPGKCQQDPSQRFPALGLVSDEVVAGEIRREGLEDCMIMTHEVLTGHVSG